MLGLVRTSVRLGICYYKMKVLILIALVVILAPEMTSSLSKNKEVALDQAMGSVSRSLSLMLSKKDLNVVESTEQDDYGDIEDIRSVRDDEEDDAEDDDDDDDNGKADDDDDDDDDKFA